MKPQLLAPISPHPGGARGEGATDMNELYREALDCLARASSLLTDAQELELALLTARLTA